MSAKQEHIHKFKRLTYKSGTQIFFCALPDCNKKLNTSLALGKRTTCWRCGEPFIMNEYSLRLAKPHCDNCHKPKKEVITEGDDSGMIHTETSEMIPSLSLAERLTQTIQQAKPEEDEI